MQAPVLSIPVLAIPVLAGPPRGTDLRRCWYVAGWADALGESPQDRIFLEEPVALFRDEAGVAHAVGGRCPHRFAPLVLGGDGGGIRARRLTQRLVAREQCTALPQDNEADA